MGDDKTGHDDRRAYGAVALAGTIAAGVGALNHWGDKPMIAAILVSATGVLVQLAIIMLGENALRRRERQFKEDFDRRVDAAVNAGIAAKIEEKLTDAVKAWHVEAQNRVKAADAKADASRTEAQAEREAAKRAFDELEQYSARVESDLGFLWHPEKEIFVPVKR